MYYQGEKQTLLHLVFLSASHWVTDWANLKLNDVKLICLLTWSSFCVWIVYIIFLTSPHRFLFSPPWDFPPPLPAELPQCLSLSLSEGCPCWYTTSNVVALFLLSNQLQKLGFDGSHQNWGFSSCVFPAVNYLDKHQTSFWSSYGNVIQDLMFLMQKYLKNLLFLIEYLYVLGSLHWLNLLESNRHREACTLVFHVRFHMVIPLLKVVCFSKIMAVFYTHLVAIKCCNASFASFWSEECAAIPLDFAHGHSAKRSFNVCTCWQGCQELFGGGSFLFLYYFMIVTAGNS